MYWTRIRQHASISRRFNQLGIRGMIFRLIIPKNKEIIQSRGINLNIDGSRNEMFNGYNCLLGYDKEIVGEVEICNFK